MAPVDSGPEAHAGFGRDTVGGVVVDFNDADDPNDAKVGGVVVDVDDVNDAEVAGAVDSLREDLLAPRWLSDVAFGGSTLFMSHASSNFPVAVCADCDDLEGLKAGFPSSSSFSSCRIDGIAADRTRIGIEFGARPGPW